MRSIYAYIAEESPSAAQIFVGEIVQQLYRIAELRLPGSSREWVKKELRAIPLKQRVIYFRHEDSYVEIVRILHSKQDIGSIFGQTNH